MISNQSTEDWTFLTPSSHLNAGIFMHFFPCSEWRPPQHVLFQLANLCFLLSYLSPARGEGMLFMHALLIVGFLLYSTWAWNVLCAPDIFSWNFTFMILNMAQLLYIIYQLRPVKFEEELENVYSSLFQPLNVSIVPVVESLILCWQRNSLDYLFIKDQFLATVFVTLIGKDIASKLYSMNKKVLTTRRGHLDIRLPSLALSMASGIVEKDEVKRYYTADTFKDSHEEEIASNEECYSLTSGITSSEYE